MDHGDASSSSLLNENSRPGLLALEGCSSSAAFQLLNNRMCQQLLEKADACYFNMMIRN